MALSPYIKAADAAYHIRSILCDARALGEMESAFLEPHTDIPPNIRREWQNSLEPSWLRLIQDRQRALHSLSTTRVFSAEAEYDALLRAFVKMKLYFENDRPSGTSLDHVPKHRAAQSPSPLPLRKSASV